MWEASDPEQALPDELPDELIQFYRALFAQEMADWPEEIREALDRTPRQPRMAAGRLTGGEERRSALRRGPPRGTDARRAADRPLLHGDRCLQAGGVQGESESLLREEIEGKRRLYTELAESVPRGEIR